MEPPRLVAERVPGEDFLVSDGCWLPYQHPRLSSAVAGMSTLKEHLERVAKTTAAVAKRERDEAVEREALEQWERCAYKAGKEMTQRCCHTAERRESLFRMYGYDMEKDPRFTGEHERHGYDGVGPDPCDPANRRMWVKQYTVPRPKPRKQSRR